MTVQRERNRRKRKLAAVAGLVALLSSGALVRASPQEAKEKEKQVLTTQNKFYCNVNALNPAERLRHCRLGTWLERAILERAASCATDEGLNISPSRGMPQKDWWPSSQAHCRQHFARGFWNR